MSKGLERKSPARRPLGSTRWGGRLVRRFDEAVDLGGLSKVMHRAGPRGLVPRGAVPPGAGLAKLPLAPETPVIAASVLALLASLEMIVRADSVHAELPLSLLLALGTTTPLALVRTNGAAAAVGVTGMSVLALTGYQALTLGGAAAQLLVLHLLGRSGARHLPLLLVVPYVAVALGHPDVAGIRIPAILLATCSAAVAAAAIGRRARSEALAQSATERAIAETLLDHAARGERARIARELHDVVAHHISMISVQAETARLTTPGMPEAGAERLLDIGDTARAALTEMRRLLGVLREDAGTPAETRRPQPGLTQLNELLDEARDAGRGSARLIVSGPVAALDPGVELAAYRIVQEALTNARRHAPGAAVDVELHYTGDSLHLRIRDNGPGPDRGAPGPGGLGHGLLGMRERATTVGGRLRSGPAPGGGFLVEATLPATTEDAR
ncbi:sensor histidine kinase [Streptomyces cavernae]|uniref:sensor histidine kinase n=1 Tax=Streptomyces cavernae TaxID=2259034 RepID=UPI0030B81803